MNVGKFMDKIPQEWLDNFSQEQLEKVSAISDKVLNIFENINLINIDKMNKDDLVSVVKKLDSVYYQYTGDEDAIGTGYKYKSDSLISACEKLTEGIIKRDNLNSNGFLNEEVLSEKLICELCSNIVYHIFCTSQERKD